MKISVEISYYPLNDEYLDPIQSFIDRIKLNNHLVVRVNGMSTQVFGEYDEVMSTITREIKKSFELPHSVFVMKVINADLQEIPA